MRVAIVRLTAMGDIVHTLASIQFIKKARPETTVTWFVEEKFAGILAHNPHVDRIVPLRLHALKRSFSFDLLRANVQAIKEAGPFDLVADVQGLLKSALVAKIAGHPVAGLDYQSAREPLASFFYTRRYAVDCAGVAPMRFATLLGQALGIEITEEMMRHKSPYLFYDDHEVDASVAACFDRTRPNVLVVTGASGAHKTYPIDRWIEVVERLAPTNVLLVAGSEAERRSARTIANATDATLLPPMDLNTLKYAVGRCDLLLGGDTGPSHLAWAMNKPSIVLFGATPETMMMQTPVNLALSAGTAPHPCRFDKSDRSIATISPSKIVEAAQRLLG